MTDLAALAAEVVAAVPLMDRIRAVLRECEWGRPEEHFGDWEGACPVCYALQCHGHASGCALAALLAELDPA